MSASENHLITLIRQVYELTKRGKLTWETTASHNRFVVVLERGAVEIQEIEPSFDPSAQEVHSHYEVRILDREGRVLDEFTSEDSQSAAEAGHLIADLYRLARASALNTDHAVQELLTELEGIGKS